MRISFRRKPNSHNIFYFFDYFLHLFRFWPFFLFCFLCNYPFGSKIRMIMILSISFDRSYILTCTCFDSFGYFRSRFWFNRRIYLPPTMLNIVYLFLFDFLIGLNNLYTNLMQLLFKSNFLRKNLFFNIYCFLINSLLLPKFKTIWYQTIVFINTLHYVIKQSIFCISCEY